MSSLPPQGLLSGSQPRRIRHDGATTSQFVKGSACAWDFRPPAEWIYDNLDSFFPGHDLDKPIIDAEQLMSRRNRHAFAPHVESGKEIQVGEQKSIRNIAAEQCDRISRERGTNQRGGVDEGKNGPPNASFTLKRPNSLAFCKGI